MPFAVCWPQRASGVFCSLSYTDASFFYTRFRCLFLAFSLDFLSSLCSFGNWPPFELWHCPLLHPPSLTPPPSCNINHSNIRCMFTWIWSNKMFYDHVALPTGNQWQMQSGLQLLGPKLGRKDARLSIWPNARCENHFVRRVLSWGFW